MPRKIRELIQDLRRAGFYEISGGGKDPHQKYTRSQYQGAVTLSGKSGDDAKLYQERPLKDAIQEIQK